ncbi:MAG: DUF1232 domain-containing protein [Planctomycetes bacterium]|nr:DUF1232 domain-containing protein [Planctomycetota bacterium]
MNRRRKFYLAIYRDPRTPWVAKAILWLALAYAVSPIDIIPDFIPVIGYLDDLLIVPFSIWLALRLVPSEVYADHEEKLKPVARRMNHD